MTYKEAFENLKTKVQLALTEWEAADEKAKELYEQAINGECLYRDIVDIVNNTEIWEFDS